MNASPKDMDTNRSHTPSNGYRSILNALIAATAINGAACINSLVQPVAPSKPNSSVSPSKPIQSPVVVNPFLVPQAELEFPGIIVEPITIGTEPPAKAWPNVPANCAYTGIVLSHDRSSVPHKILIENMCLQERAGIQNVFAGQHLWIAGNSKGRFDIPFEYSHLQEKGGDLIFVVEAGKKHVEEPLVAGIEPNTSTFAPLLNKYEIGPIVSE